MGLRAADFERETQETWLVATAERVSESGGKVVEREGGARRDSEVRGVKGNGENRIDESRAREPGAMQGRSRKRCRGRQEDLGSPKRGKGFRNAAREASRLACGVAAKQSCDPESNLAVQHILESDRLGLVKGTQSHSRHRRSKGAK